MHNFLSFLRIYKIFGRRFGFIRTTLKIASYELSNLSSHISDANSVVDLGGGEGLLSAILKSKNPKVSFQVIDLNDSLVDFVLSFREVLSLEVKKLDILNLTSIPDAEIYLLNDVLHHLPYDDQEKLLESLLHKEKSSKKIIIRDVIKGRNVDYFLTKLIDRHLYPEDPLNFRTFPDWLSVLESLSVQKFELRKHFFGWPSNKLQIVIWK